MPLKVPHNNAGAIAIQAFSGFSINGEPIAGDKPDSVNCIDSETGSMAVDVSRQAVSETHFYVYFVSDSVHLGLLRIRALLTSVVAIKQMNI